MPLIDGRLADAGEIIWIDFGPPFGHEQAGRRPGLVLSPARYNRVSSLMLVCPITRNDRPWPFKVALPSPGLLTGYILADQVRSIDPAIRIVKRSGHSVPQETLAAVRGVIASVIGVVIK
jgi:mRNA interferase MazF